MIRVPNMDTPHDWLLALESEVLRGVDQSESTSKYNSERMIFLVQTNGFVKFRALFFVRFCTLPSNGALLYSH